MKRTILRCALLGSAAFLAIPAGAQEVVSETVSFSTDSAIEDIIVTAQKRSESVQGVPLAITALSGGSLTDRNISDVASLATAVPNMTFGTYGGSARIAIRGVGYDNVAQGHEGRVAYHMDGVYVSRPAAILGTFYDIERVEVLRGPQGTLYGRNATGGSVNVITKAPTDDWQGNAQIGYGNYNAVISDGAIGGPIATGVRFRVAYTFENHDGWGKNVVTGNDIDNARRRGVRGTLSFDLGSSGKLDISSDYYREKDANYGNHAFGAGNPAVPLSGLVLGGFIPEDIRDIANDFDPINERESYGFAARAEIDLGGATLKSISAYRNSDFMIKTDFDATSAPLSEADYYERSRQLSEELQVSGKIGNLRYIVGAYYFDEKIFGGNAVPLSLALFGSPSFQIVQGFRGEGDIRTKAVAGFGQLDYDISDILTFTAGGRYSWERHEISDQLQFDLSRPYPPRLPNLDIYNRKGLSTTDKAFTPRLQISYKPEKGLMFYASLSKGFKSGGFDIGGGAPAFEPETLLAYEGGMKGTFANGRVRINAAGFYYDYTNLQVSKVLFSAIQIVNAASSVVYGAEAELTIIPVDGFQIDAAPAWLHTEYKNFSTANPSNPLTPLDQSGNQLSQAPEISLRLGAEYSWSIGSGRVKLRGEMNYQDRIYFTPFNENLASRVPNTKFNAFFNLDQGHWHASLYALNLTNRTTVANALVASAIAGSPILGTLEPPRTYGIKVGYRF